MCDDGVLFNFQKVLFPRRFDCVPKVLPIGLHTAPSPNLELVMFSESIS